MVAAALAPGVEGEIVNLASGDERKLIDVAHLVHDIALRLGAPAGPGLAVGDLEYRPGEAMRFFGDTEKMSCLAGLPPGHPLRAGARGPDPLDPERPPATGYRRRSMIDRREGDEEALEAFEALTPRAGPRHGGRTGAHSSRRRSLRRDRRGTVFREVYVVTLAPGAVRGEHFHRETAEWFIPLNGRVEIRIEHTRKRVEKGLRHGRGAAGAALRAARDRASHRESR